MPFAWMVVSTSSQSCRILRHMGRQQQLQRYEHHHSSRASMAQQQQHAASCSHVTCRVHEYSITCCSTHIQLHPPANCCHRPHSCSAAAKHEGKAASKSKLKLDSEGKAPSSFDSIAEDDVDSEEAGPQFDYSQYYPGTLPLQLHHPEDDAGQPALQAMLMRQGVPQDLVLRQVRVFKAWLCGCRVLRGWVVCV